MIVAVVNNYEMQKRKLFCIPKITEFIKQKESKKEDFNSSSSQLIQMFGG